MVHYLAPLEALVLDDSARLHMLEETKEVGAVVEEIHYMYLGQILILVCQCL